MADGVEYSGKQIKNEIKSKSSKIVSVGIPALGLAAGLMFKDFFGIRPRVTNFLVKRAQNSKAETTPTTEQINKTAKIYSAVIYLLAGGISKAFIGGLIGKVIMCFCIGTAISFYWSF